jgi:two-component system sensor histidine kinase BaeS
MISSIRTKLFAAMFLACLLAIGGMTLLIQYSFQSNLLDYVNEQEKRALSQLETQLLEYYRENHDWQKLKNTPRLWQHLVAGALRSSLLPANGDEPIDEPPPPPPKWEDRQGDHAAVGGLPPPRSRMMQRVDRYIGRVVLLDDHRQLVRGNERLAPPDNLQLLILDDKTIGYLGLHPRQNLTEKVDVEFAERLQRTVWIVGFISLLIAGILAFGLSRHFVKPIQALRQGTRQLTDGNYALRMIPYSADELGQLTHDFNLLAERLQQTESCRKQWIADIAHELRTPLAILRGEIEALQDGINQPNTSTFASLHQEVSNLQRLVSDLYDLSMSDSGALSYRKEPCDVIALLRETLDLYSTSFHDQQLQLDTRGMGLQPMVVQGDPQRLQQLFKNLVENSLRYTDKPGQLRLTTWQTHGNVVVCWQDSLPGVPDDALPRLFERLYRVENSRNRATGGAGLGLSICHNIVAAHNGSLKAAHSPLGGLEICVTLPLTA